MKNKGIIRYLFYAFLLLSVGLFHTACEDDPLDAYRVGDEDPSDWNGNIYDYLKGEGCYNYYVRIIDMAEEDGIKYSEVLSRTGSKTLFVVKDEAFEVFFASNEYGIRRFEDLSVTQCRSILFGNMLNNAYVLDMLANISGADRATAGTMRRTASLPTLDSIPFERGDVLPYNRFWDRFRENGVHLMTDAGKRDAYTMVHFLERHMKLAEVSITDEDFYVMTHVNRQAGDAYLFDVKIIERNIRCKNGYVNVLERVLLPRDNMAEYIRKNPNTSVFSRFLERYAIPLVSPLNDAYKRMYPEATDTLFSKVFMNKTNFLEGGSMTIDGEIITLSSLLNFDPGNNGYAPSNKLEQDMGAIFVPTDAALNEYFTSGSGRFLQERYGSWDSVPDLVLDKLINNHMRLSFINSIPSRFSALEDKMGTKMGVQPEDIEYAYICSNGIVYVTNKVYSPTEYVSIMAPVRTNENTSIFAWTIDRLQFDLYLLSMENQFTFLVPTDDAFDNYIDPSSLKRGKAERWRFWIDPRSPATPRATVYDALTGDSIRVEIGASNIESHLNDIMDNHIIVGSLESGKRFYETKGGSVIQIASLPGDQIAVQGGGNIEKSETVHSLTGHRYQMGNGDTYFLDHVVQPATRSVYSILNDSLMTDFEEFYNLCWEAHVYEYDRKKYGGQIFDQDPAAPGVDQNIKFFNTFNYTVYVPTNAAIRNAIYTGEIKTWAEIDAMDDSEEKGQEVDKLYAFLRHHFQDNSVYISGEPVNNEYETAALNPDTKKFRKLKLEGNGSQLSVTPIIGKALSGDNIYGTTVSVVTSNPQLYNIMVRDYKFNSGPAPTRITTSSFAVIHQIDGILKY